MLEYIIEAHHNIVRVNETPLLFADESACRSNDGNTFVLQKLSILQIGIAVGQSIANAAHFRIDLRILDPMVSLYSSGCGTSSFISDRPLPRCGS